MEEIKIDLISMANTIKNKELREMTVKILDDNSVSLKILMASISGKYHQGETLEQHLYKTYLFGENIITEMNLSDNDSDVLKASIFLHDISKTYSTTIERNPNEFQKLYVEKWNRGNESEYFHGVLSEFIIGKYVLENHIIDNVLIYKTAMAVSTHMGHWNPDCPQPSNDIQKYLALADYLASRKNVKIE